MLLSEVVKKLNIEEPFILKADGEYDILERCTTKTDDNILSFIESEKYIADVIDNECISCIICTPILEASIPFHIKGIITTNNPKELFYAIHNSFKDIQIPTRVGKDSYISKLSSVAVHNVVIGNNVKIHDFVVIKEGTIIEDDCEIFEHCTIGGKSFVPIQFNGNKILASDLGKTYIKKGTKICGNCYIARGTLQSDSTVVGENCLFDTMVYVGHGVHIGNDTSIAAGETVTGNFAINHEKFIENLKRNR